MSGASNIARNQNTGTVNSPRWWRLRRQSPVEVPLAAAAQVVEEPWTLKLDRMCQQIAQYLPPISASTRKAIVCLAALVIGWKFVIWTLELVVTGACFALAVAILLCFVRPDIALWMVTQVLPPYMDEVRVWLSNAFTQAGQLLDRGPPGTSSIPLPAIAPSPPLPYPTPRSPRTTVIRALPEVGLVPPTNA